MNDSRDFRDAESVRSGNSHVTSRPVSFPPYPIPEGMLRHSIGMTHMEYRETFLQIQQRLLSTLSAGIESMEFSYIKTNSLITSREERESNTSSGSEMPVQSTSKKFIRPQ